MQMLEVKIRKFQLFFQEIEHGVRYILQANLKSSSLVAQILVNPFNPGVVIMWKSANGFSKKKLIDKIVEGNKETKARFV